MNVLITGTSKGIGKACASLFLSRGFNVFGFDVLPSTIEQEKYHHNIVDVSRKETFPNIPPIEILINNAGTQNKNDIEVNLIGTVNITERYGIHEGIKSIVNNASASAHTGAEFPLYSASKGGVLAYTKNVALRIAQYGACCNSVSFGGVLTELNEPVIKDRKAWKEIMDVTPLKKWMNVEEAAEWIYFIAVKNTFMTAQDVLIDGGESSNMKFVWRD